MRTVIATLAFSAATACLLASHIQAADNLSFKGVLFAQACTIRPGDELIPVEFSDISTASLYLNTRSPGELFLIHLKDCDTGPLAPAVCEFWLSPTAAPLSRVSVAAIAAPTCSSVIPQYQRGYRRM